MCLTSVRLRRFMIPNPRFQLEVVEIGTECGGLARRGGALCRSLVSKF